MKNTASKYKNYKELSEAFKSRELDPEKYRLILDKGGTENYLEYQAGDDEDEASADAKQEECRKLFRGENTGIGELFDALDIPWEWC